MTSEPPASGHAASGGSPAGSWRGACPGGPAGAATRLLNQRCQLCFADLGGHKRFYKRYRVCERDALSPEVCKDGLAQRFCQQCGRFHPLALFDGTMRTCRDQLARHASLKRKRRRAKAALRTGRLAPEEQEEEGEEEAPAPRRARRSSPAATPRQPHALAVPPAAPQPPPLLPPLPAPLPLAAPPQLPAHALQQLLLKQRRQQVAEAEEQQVSCLTSHLQTLARRARPCSDADLLERQPSVNSQPEPPQAARGRWSVQTPSPQPQSQLQPAELPSHQQPPAAVPAWHPPAPAGGGDLLLASLLAILKAAAEAEQARRAQAAASLAFPGLLGMLAQLSAAANGSAATPDPALLAVLQHLLQAAAL